MKTLKQMKTKENSFIYALKFIACLLVITIHARIPGTVGDIVFSIARFAVPFFFAVSGRFLLVGKDGMPIMDVPSTRKKVSLSLRKLLRITAIVYSIYLIYSFFINNMIYKTPVSEFFSSRFNIGEIVRFLLFNAGRVVFDYSYVFDHQWYLFALIYVYVLIYVFAPVLRSWYKALIIILLSIMFFGELLQTYYPIRPFDISIQTPYMLRNWLFEGIPFVLMGILFSDHVCNIRSKGEDYAARHFEKLRVPAALLISVGVISSVVEAFVIDFKEVYFGSLLIVVGVLFLSESVDIRSRVLSILGKRASSNIYFYHVLIIAILDFLSQNGMIPGYSMLQKPFIVMFICFIVFCIKPLWEELREVKN